MSGDCDKCSEHALECKCSSNAGDMAIKIYEAIYNSDPKIMGYAPDALIRVLVYLAHKNGWTLEKTVNEVAIAVKYYYAHEELLRHRIVP